jgi:flagellar hook-associated protein 1 FlgK
MAHWDTGEFGMATISSALSLIASALEADQSALNIVANNVANSNTVGYARQVPNWQETSRQRLAALIMGPV